VHLMCQRRPLSELCTLALHRRRCTFESKVANCEEADLASLGWICFAEQRCTDAGLVLDAPTRVPAAAGSGLIDLNLHCVVDIADGSHQPCMLGVARKLTLRASGGSATPRSDAQTQRSC
jgi:hypothetical protein